MKVDLSELRAIVEQLVVEAKKSKKKDDEEIAEAHPGAAGAAFGSYSDSFDFSEPQGEWNRLRQQGVTNWGPYTTGPGEDLGLDRVSEGAVRSLVREVIEENSHLHSSAWDSFAPAPSPGNVWESVLHWYDYQGRGLGQDALGEAHIGFEKLKGKLAHKKGVKDPGALAASIGRKKYGKKKFAQMAKKGKK